MSRPVSAGRRPPLRPLLRARLRPPSTASHYLRRPRLLELLDETVSAPVTIVVAPAGSGKTSLLSGWVADASMATAWLSLDDGDNDGPQLWSGLTEALETLAPGCGDRTRALLRRGAVNKGVRQLIADLPAEGPSPAVLVIDDEHLVDDDDAVAASLAFFLRQMPSWLHVVMASRREPKLPLDKMRARGELGEVHFRELKFSRDEARELLSRLAPGLPDDTVNAAAERADGWAASLQMAALTARSARAQAGVEAPRLGDDMLVQDYVMHEVLAREPPELVDMLVDISVVERVNASLAGALTARSDVAEQLSRAEARGLFVTRLGPEGWFEIHSLARAALVAELARRSHGQLVERHRRAAKWFEDVGEVALALDHLLLGCDWRAALDLLAAHHAELYDAGREAVIKRGIAAMPDSVAATDLESMIDFALCHLLVNRRRFLELVEQTTWWASRSVPSGNVHARLTMLQSDGATVEGSWCQSAELARLAMREFGDLWRDDRLGRFGWNTIAREVALSERWDDKNDTVREAELALARDSDRRLAFEGTRALGEALAGRPTDALRVAAGVRQAAVVSNRTILRTELDLAEAIAHREMGDRPRAVAELEALAGAPAEATLIHRLLASLELVQARLDAGDVEAAERAFGQAEDLVQGEPVGANARDWFGRAGTVVAVAAGETDAARRWSKRVEDPFWLAASLARVHLMEGNRTDAFATLQTAAPRCVRQEVVLRLLRARAAGNHDQAMTDIGVAVELAAVNGVLQTVASEGPDVIHLVELVAWEAPEAWIARLRRAAVGHSGAAVLGSVHLAEPLTERELEVLRFLPSRLTVREIANELYISQNTLKFHLKVIYRKLGVNSRAGAATRVRSLGQVHLQSQRPI